MPKKNLTVRTIDALRATQRQVDYFDDDVPGFCIRVAPSGRKTFCVFYRIGRHLRRYTLGCYPIKSLADARAEARDAILSASKGHDLALQKKARREADTFEELVEIYVEEYAKHKRSGRETKRILNKYVVSKLRHIGARDVTRAQLRAIIREVATNAPIQANRVLAAVRKLFNWAIAEEHVELNPCHKLPAPAAERRRDRVLSDAEIKAVWKACEAETSPVADVYKLRLVTAQRGGEVQTMAWADVDLENRWWTIPAERSKNKLPHRVWLSDPAVRILERRQQANSARKRRSQSKWVFPGKRKGQPLMEPKKVKAAIAEVSKVENWTGHDLRRTAASMMASIGIPRFVIGRVLNHAEPGVTAVYDRHSYDAEKKDALEKWARRLMATVSDLKAVSAAAEG